MDREVAIESSICTGEKLIGFRNRVTGRLEEAVVVRDPKDIDAFYREHHLKQESNSKKYMVKALPRTATNSV